MPELDPPPAPSVTLASTDEQDAGSHESASLWVPEIPRKASPTPAGAKTDGDAPPGQIALQPPTNGATVRSRPLRVQRPTQFPQQWIELLLGVDRVAFSVGLGGMYFPTPYIGIGGIIKNTLYYSLVNELTILPKLRVVMLPYRRWSPYVRGGIGVAVISGSWGVWGATNAGGGIMVRAGQRLVFNLGVDLDSLLPDAAFRRGVDAGVADCGPIVRVCSMSISPHGGITVGF